MPELHGLFGYAALGFAPVLFVISGVTWLIGTNRLGRTLSRVADLMVVASAGLVLLALLVGPILLAMDKRPNEWLHILYAFVALAILPISVGLGIRAEHGRGKSPTRYGWIALGALVLTVIAWRLSVTG
jgi:hypothetical protein